MQQRTIQEIHQAILQEKQQHAALQDLDEQKTNGVFYTLTYVMASVLWLQEQRWFQFKKELKANYPLPTPGTLPWFVERLKAWQEGHSLHYADGHFFYETKDEQAQTIAHVAHTTHGDGSVALHVAQDDAGAPAELNANQEAEVKAYLDQIQPIGLAISLNSLAPHRLRPELDITLKSSWAISDALQLLKDSIREYCLELQPDTLFTYHNFSLFVQSLEPVRQVNQLTVQIVDEAGQATSVSGEYTFDSGFLYPDDTAGYTLNDLLSLSY